MEHMIGVLVGALLAGLLIGLVPLIYGTKKKQTGLAAGGFAACIVGALILGAILAIPVAGVFVWLIHSKAKAAALEAPAASPPIPPPEPPAPPQA